MIETKNTQIFMFGFEKKKEKVKIMNQTTTMSANFFTDVLKLVI